MTDIVSPAALRLVAAPGRTRLAYPATIDLQDEEEERDLVGDPVKLELDGQLLHSLVCYPV